jgi:diguanylate cyclase (GGDEF)-like protein
MAGRAAVTSEGVDGRIGDVVALLTQLASGDLTVRGTRSEYDDDVDAVIEGINMLAEDLEASRDEMEQRVQDRTAELQRLNQDVLRLTELGNLLQASETTEEAYSVIAHSLAGMFDGLSGALYVYRASRNSLVLKSAWGTPSDIEHLAPSECWALRRGHQHLVSAAEPGLSCQHVHHRSGDSLCIPLSAQGETVGLLHLMDHRLDSQSSTARLTEAKQSLGVAVGEQAALALTNLEMREKLRMQALRDPLTGLLNRRFLEEWISREAARTDESGQPFGVIMADLDHFKAINDLHGHEAGDRLLTNVADVLRRSLRDSDMPCRYGGEEFLILLTGVDLPTLTARAEAIRNSIAHVRVDYRGATLPGVTVSAGIALYPLHGATAADVVLAADTALYAAKHAGRNRTVTATSLVVRP